MNRPAYDPATQGIFEWAKCSAIAARRDKLGVGDLFCGIYAVVREGLLSPEGLGLLGRPLKSWPDAAADAHTAASRTPVDEARARKLPFDDGLRKIIDAAYAESATLPPGVLVQAFGESGTSARVDTALAILETLRSQLPALPVYLFSENPEARQSFEQVVKQVLERGGARGFLPCRRDAGNDILVDDFLAQGREVAEEARDATLIRQAPREEVAVRAEDRAT